MCRTVCCLLALTLAGMPVVVGQKPVELGLDAGFSYKTNSPTLFVAAVPVQSFRVGFFASDQVSVEPRLSLNLFNVSGEGTLTTLGAELGVLAHFSRDRERPQGYFRPLAGVNLITGGGETASQFSVGGALGVKLPVKNRFAVRLEGGFRHGFESDEMQKAPTAFVQIGFSASPGCGSGPWASRARWKNSPLVKEITRDSFSGCTTATRWIVRESGVEMSHSRDNRRDPARHVSQPNVWWMRLGIQHQRIHPAPRAPFPSTCHRPSLRATSWSSG